MVQSDNVDSIYAQLKAFPLGVLNLNNIWKLLFSIFCYSMSCNDVVEDNMLSRKQLMAKKNTEMDKGRI